MVRQDSLRKIDHEHLLTLYDITEMINSSLDFEQVLHNVMDAVMQVMRAQRGFLMVVDEASGVLEVKVARSPEGENLAPYEAYSTTVVNQVLASRQPLLTNNAQVDPQFSMANSVMLNKLRAILCAPMLLMDRLIGVIYVDSSIRARVFGDSDVHLINAVAGQAAIAIENARLYLMAVEKGRLERELQMAREMQMSLLPRTMPRLPGYEIAASWQSAREMAGDFYDGFLIDSETMGVVIADVSDKGAAAALCMASTRSMIRMDAFGGSTPSAVLRRTNDLLVQDIPSGMFVTAYYSAFKIDGTAVHVNAGHNPPLVYRRRTGAIEAMPRGGRALGWFVDNPVHETRMQLEPGDVIVYYTDGIIEAEGDADHHFGEARLAETILRSIEGSAEEIIRAVGAALDEHCYGDELQDDRTICVVRYDPLR
ncbi:MAG: SpoIIE family protein phosphatase [Anaerolineae bacterium]|nr:SpoIIE family protein phosphatase [Anaerolineae bacterium]NUQ03593.1 SpoIIE family protein phosphatase [Anaerolineae bacterium]